MPRFIDAIAAGVARDNAQVRKQLQTARCADVLSEFNIPYRKVLPSRGMW